MHLHRLNLLEYGKPLILYPHFAYLLTKLDQRVHLLFSELLCLLLVIVL
jgi:hypothetical protein